MVGEKTYYDYKEMDLGTKVPSGGRKVKECPACHLPGLVTVNKDGSFKTIHDETLATFEFEGKEYHARVSGNYGCAGSWGSAQPSKKADREALEQRRADYHEEQAKEWGATETNKKAYFAAVAGARRAEVV